MGTPRKADDDADSPTNPPRRHSSREFRRRNDSHESSPSQGAAVQSAPTPPQRQRSTASNGSGRGVRKSPSSSGKAKVGTVTSPEEASRNGRPDGTRTPKKSSPGSAGAMNKRSTRKSQSSPESVLPRNVTSTTSDEIDLDVGKTGSNGDDSSREKSAQRKPALRSTRSGSGRRGSGATEVEDSSPTNGNARKAKVDAEDGSHRNDDNDGYTTDNNKISPTNHQSPVKEITFLSTDNDNNGQFGGDDLNNNMRPSHRSRHHHHHRHHSLDHAHHHHKKKLRKAPPDLDEDTFRVVKEYLEDINHNQTLFNPLGDDDVAAFMLRMYHISSRQTEYQHHLFSTGVGNSDDAYGMNSDDDDSSLFFEILAEEEEHSIGNELFKAIAADIREKRRDDDFELDNRTLNWIKRAAGLCRSSASLARRDAIRQSKLSSAAAAAAAASPGEADADGGDGNETNSRRLVMKTRTAARQSRVAKRQRGLKLLTDALDEIEDEFGPFPAPKPKRKKVVAVVPPPPLPKPTVSAQQQKEKPKQAKASKRQRDAFQAEDESLKKKKKVKKEPPLIATIRRKHNLQHAVLMNGTVVFSLKNIVISKVILSGVKVYDAHSKNPFSAVSTWLTCFFARYH